MLTEINRVVVVGAGYGGLHVAQELGDFFSKQRRGELVLIDRNNYHLIETKLHEVAAASIEPERVQIPFSDLISKYIHFKQATVTGFDYPRKAVLTDVGEVRYDILVIALGSETDYFGIPGMEQNTLGLKSLDEAMEVREHIRHCFMAAREETDLETRRALLTFVIGGGGFTGTELAAEIADWLPHLAKEFAMERGDARLIVVEGGPTILPGFNPDLISRSMKVLANKGVEVRLNSICAETGAGYVRLKSGDAINTNMVIWTGGVRAQSLVSKSGLSTGAKGRVIVNPYLESVDQPGVYIVGDCVLVVDRATNRPIAPSAQVALQEAATTAGNIAAVLEGRGRKTFEPNLRGEFVSLGRSSGVGIVMGVKTSGRLALMLKRVNEMRYLEIIGGPSLVLRYLFRAVGAPPEEEQPATTEASKIVAKNRRIAK